MTKNVLVLTDAKPRASGKIKWGKIGTVVNGVSQLYQIVSERPVDMVLVDVNRHDVNQAVATKIRRSNGLTDVWKVVDAGASEDEIAPVFDGSIQVDLGTSGIIGKVKRILAEKQLLAEFGLVGRSAPMRALVHTIDRIAPTEVSVLVVGPSGSGKELVAQALHAHSSRADGPFVVVNCGALAEGILESELFGHEKGAFTGSVGKREGLFHKAAKGTIFLDEIGETKPDMQVKLLRVLEDGTYYPVGSSSPQRTDARVIAATVLQTFGTVTVMVFTLLLLLTFTFLPAILVPLDRWRSRVRNREYVPLVTADTEVQGGLVL